MGNCFHLDNHAALIAVLMMFLWCKY